MKKGINFFGKKQVLNPILYKFWIPDPSLIYVRIDIKKLNTSDIIFDRFMEEWKIIYIPNVFVNNYIDIKYQKLNGLDVWSGIVHFKEPMLIFGTIFSVKFHCEMEDTIIKFPFDKHCCNIEVNCSSRIVKKVKYINK